MGNNIIFNKKLEEYNKKYRNGRYKLLKYTKKEVEQYDKYANQTLKTKNHLLKGRKWALIGDTYYEIPKAPRALWFRNINAGVKAATCALVGGAVAGGAGYGIYVAVANGKQPVKPDPGPQPQPEPIIDRVIELDPSSSEDGLIIKSKTKTDTGIEIVLDLNDEVKEKGTVLGDDINVKIGNAQLTDDEYDYLNHILSIPNETLENHDGNIEIKPVYAEAYEEEEEFLEDYEEQGGGTFQDDAKENIEHTKAGVNVTDGNGNKIRVNSFNYYKDGNNNETSLMNIDIGGGQELPIIVAGGIYAPNKIDAFIDEIGGRCSGEVILRRVSENGGFVITGYDTDETVLENYIFDENGYMTQYKRNGAVYNIEYTDTKAKLQSINEIAEEKK